MKNYDVLVIGSGSGNIIIDEALKKNLKCAMVEKDKFGGTCLTRGCIPTKVLTTVASFIRNFERIKNIGIDVKKFSLDFNKISNRVWEKIDESKDVLKYYAHKDNLDLYIGTAKFIDNKTVKILYNGKSQKDEIITADKIIIAAGARTKIPQINNIENIGYLTSESFFGHKFPKKIYDSITILGGGYIGLEFAHIFSALGAKVTILQRNKYLIPKSEKEISEKICNIFENNGIKIYTDVDVINCEVKNGMKYLKIQNRKTKDIQEIESEELFLAPGVISNADLLDLKNTNIRLDERNYIKTNEFLETNVKDIYAIGDINGKFQFKHKANQEAEFLAYNLFELGLEGYKDKLEKYKFVNYSYVPGVTYTFPEVAMLGLNEEQARANFKEIEVAKNFYSSTAKGYALGNKKKELEDGMVKIIIDKNTRKILGVHIIGEEASLLLQPFVEILNSGKIPFKVENEDISSQFSDEIRKLKNHFMFLEPQTIDVTDNTMVSHPSLSEASIWTKYMDFI